MKKILFILLSTLSLTIYAQKPKLAVYMTGDDPINEIVSNRLVDDLARSNEYTTVERTASFLSALSKEHKYERSGEVNDEQIAALGKQFNVQYVCVASVLDVWGNEKYITARIIDAETAEVVASSSSNGSIQSSSDLIGALNTLSKDFLKAMHYNKQSNAKKVAVYVTKTGNRDVDIVLGDQLVAGFAKSGRYAAIERTGGFLQKIKEEQGYQQSGAVDDDDLTRLGQQFGVNYVCVVKTTAWAGDFFISTRMIDVKTGEVVNSNRIEGARLNNSQNVVKVAQGIAAELSKGTFAEQAEEARIKAEEEARRRAEELQSEQQKAEIERKRDMVRNSISKYYFENIGFYFPRVAPKKSTIYKNGHTIELKTPLYFDFYGYDCYGGEYKNGYVNGLVYLKRNNKVKLMYIINNEIMYPYLECTIYQGHFLLSLEEGKCSYGCMSGSWEKPSNRQMCRNFSEIYNRDITTDQFMDGLINMKIPLKDLENAFLDFLGSGKRLSNYECR